MFFGNTGTNANTTPATLANTGNATCRGGTINRTAYWAPAMVDRGKVIDPNQLLVYYKSGYTGVRKESIVPPPVGLRMIAGDASRTTRPAWGPISFSCENEGTRYLSIAEVACAPGQRLWMSVGFPQCWDNVLYGSDLGSNYQGQVTMLSKHFEEQTAGVPVPVDA